MHKTIGVMGRSPGTPASSLLGAFINFGTARNTRCASSLLRAFINFGTARTLGFFCLIFKKWASHKWYYNSCELICLLPTIS
jgi:hypothetical protein